MQADASSPAGSPQVKPEEDPSAKQVPALPEIEKKYRLLFDGSRDALMVMAPPKWRFSDANHATLQLFGASSKAEFIAIGPRHVSPPRQPDGRSSPEKAEEMLATCLRTGSHLFEWEHQRLNGETFAADVLLTRMDVDGQIVVQATVRDITVRKQAELALQQSEAKFRTILDISPVAHALSDEQKNITLLNTEFIKTFGYTLEDIPDLAAWWAKAYPDPAYRQWVRGVWRQHLEKTKREGIAFEPIEVNIHCKKGKVRTALVTSVALGGPSGKTYLAIFYDITERKLAEQQAQAQSENLARINAELMATNTRLGLAQNQLLQSEKLASIGLLAAGVAHEINNPIGYVFSNVGTLEKYLADIFAVVSKYEEAERLMENHPREIEDVRQFKAQIDLDYLREDIKSLLAESREGLMRVKKIVQDLKDFSHAGGEEEWKWADLQQGLESTLGVVWNELKYKCEVKQEYGKLPLVQCLPSQLNQVFMNLLVNAAQAIETRGVVTIRTGQEGDQVWVEIADTGKGIAPENLPHLFDPFFTTKPVGQGTGLGLSVSYSIVEKHHGRFEVHSELGKGTTFRVWLPVKQADGVVPA